MYWNYGTLCKSILLIKININIRCIEIVNNWKIRYINIRLTLTWDVLKYNLLMMFCWVFHRLTLTWDVLKYDVDVEKLTDGVD